VSLFGTPPAGGRIAVLGGAGGIGRAVVGGLGAAGCRVAVLDLAASLKAHPVAETVWARACDATDAAEVGAAFAALQAEWGGLEGLVHLVGFAGTRAAVADADPAEWEAVAAGNLRSAMLAARAAWPLLRAGTAPAMVLTASGLAQRAAPGYGAYAAAKAGVLALTRTLAAEGAPWLRVNAVAPSAVATEFLTGGTGRAPMPGRFDAEAYARAVPLGRLARAEEVAAPILFLLSPGAGYITGQTLHVNGGQITP